MKNLKGCALLLLTILFASPRAQAEDCKPAYKPHCVLQEYYKENLSNREFELPKDRELSRFTIDLNDAEIANLILDKWPQIADNNDTEDPNRSEQYDETRIKLLFTSGQIEKGKQAIIARNTYANKESNYRTLWPLYLRGDYNTMFSLAEQIAAVDGTNNVAIIASCVRRPNNYPWPVGFAAVDLAKAGKTEEALRGLKIIQNFREHSKILYNCLRRDATNAHIYASIEIAKILVENDKPERAKQILEEGVSFLSRIHKTPGVLSFWQFGRYALTTQRLFPDYNFNQFVTQLDQRIDKAAYMALNTTIDSPLALLLKGKSYDLAYDRAENLETILAVYSDDEAKILEAAIKTLQNSVSVLLEENNKEQADRFLKLYSNRYLGKRTDAIDKTLDYLFAAEAYRKLENTNKSLQSLIIAEQAYANTASLRPWTKTGLDVRILDLKIHHQGLDKALEWYEYDQADKSHAARTMSELTAKSLDKPEEYAQLKPLLIKHLRGDRASNASEFMDLLIEDERYDEFFDILSSLDDPSYSSGVVRLINAYLIGNNVPESEVLRAWEVHREHCSTDCNKNYLYSMAWFANNRHLSAVDWYW